MKNRYFIPITAAIIFLFIILIIITAHKNEDALNASSGAKGFGTVIIDAGHGSPDGGAVAADGTLEKDINLNVAKKLDTVLTLLGVDTVMTRETDGAIYSAEAKTIRQKKVSDIHNRMSIMIKNPDAIFVSIHQNHYPSAKYGGAQVFYSTNRSESEHLASCLRDGLRERLQPDNTREIKKSGTEIYLLYHAPIPAVMAECGFLSNAEDTAKLKDGGYCRCLAFALASGICEYFNTSGD